MFRLLSVLMAATMMPVPLAQAQQKPKRVTRLCRPIARIVSPQPKQLCFGFNYSLDNNFQAFCYSTARLIPIVGGQLSEECLPPKARTSDRGKRKTFGKRRGKQKKGVTLLQPLGSVILSPQPKISWVPYSEVGEYQIGIIPSGEKPLWYRQVNGSIMDYPQDVQPLEPGSVYTLLSQHVSNDYSNGVIQDSKILIVLNQEQQQAINQAESVIRSFALNEDEQALDLELVYRRYGLQQASVNLLEQRVVNGSQNPDVFRVLGDIYLDEDLLDKARQNYQQAIALATAQNRTDTLAAVQKALTAIDDSAALPNH